jgi:hypothetical protein
MCSSTFLIQKQINNLEPSDLQKFFAWFIPYSTPVMSYFPKDSACDAPADGLFIGAVAGSVLLPLGLSFTAAVTIPPTIFAGLFAAFFVAQMRENNRDVELAKHEIKYLNNHFNAVTSTATSTSIVPPTDTTVNTEKGAFKNQALQFFNTEELKKYSKDNILSLILKHEDKDTRIALLEACMDKTTKLGERMWKREGFFECNAISGTLGKIKNILHTLKNDNIKCDPYRNASYVLGQSLNRR